MSVKVNRMNMKTSLFCALAGAECALGAVRVTAAEVDLVDPFIGTGGTGHCTPAATAPFGMVQAGPDTGTGDSKWSSSYRYDDGRILGFSQSHLNGTGGGEYGDVQIVPFCDGTYCEDGCDFSHGDEKASPGYYAVRLPAYGVAIEATASERVAAYRFRYEKGHRAHVLVNLPYATRSSWSKREWLAHDERVEDARTIAGVYTRKVWATRTVGYIVRFSRPASEIRRLEPVGGEPPRFDCVFDLADGASLEVRIALSRKDAVGAKTNLATSEERDFDALRAETRARWQALLSRFAVEAPDADRRQFYTALYHTAVQPNLLSDFGERTLYTTLSLWDVHRAAFPLYALYAPEMARPIADSFLYFYEKQGYLPVFTLGDCEVLCMIGEHSIPILEQWRKCGLCADLDWNYVADAVADTLRGTLPNRGGFGGFQYDLINEYGYLPHDKVRGQSVSRTLEACLDYQAAADLARALGRTAEADGYAAKAKAWTNLYDRATEFFRGKNADGTWKTPFDPLRCDHGTTVGGEYTEANAWQYRWHVMQHPEELVATLGGSEKTAAELDRLFSLPSVTYGNDCLVDVTGLIGQYAHGNEPCHHVPYLYQYAGRPDRTAERVAEIFRTQYTAAPDGLCGNDDCGQMSAWYVFAALGFYPFNPISGEYVIGAPQVRKIVLRLATGKTFTVLARNLSKENLYVKSVSLNGKPLAGWKIRHADIVRGGELTFEMGPR